MQLKEFIDLLSYLYEQKIPLLGCEFHHTISGSWYVLIDHEPKLRIIWDARDKLLIIDKGKEDKWEDVWMTKIASEQTVASIATKLKNVMADLS